MALRTTLGIGGKADVIVHPLDMDDLREILDEVRERGVPLLVVGSGSNLLVRDGGIRGVVVCLDAGFREIRSLPGGRLYCGAGTLLAMLLSFAAERGLGGMEFLAGVPGTVGGAVRMNAGAFGSEMKDVVQDVTFVTMEGAVTTMDADELCFTYRSLETGEGDVVTGCTLALGERPEDEIRELMKRYSMERRLRQPLRMPTAGSVFKNPPGGFAARLIDEAGLKGTRLGGARVSEKHANFIENLGGARAADVISLMELVREKVYGMSGVLLEPEVRIVGEEEHTCRGVTQS